MDEWHNIGPQDLLAAYLCTITPPPPWAAISYTTPDAIECELLATEVGYDEELQTGEDPDPDPEEEELPQTGSDSLEKLKGEELDLSCGRIREQCWRQTHIFEFNEKLEQKQKRIFIFFSFISFLTNCSNGGDYE